MLGPWTWDALEPAGAEPLKGTATPAWSTKRKAAEPYEDDRLVPTNNCTSLDAAEFSKFVRYFLGRDSQIFPAMSSNDSAEPSFIELNDVQ